MTTSFWVAAIRGSSASMNAAASATVLCIFQLAAMYGVRSGICILLGDGLLVEQRFNSGQLLPLQQLQRGAAAGREPIDPVAEAKLDQRRDRVATADHRRPRPRGDGRGDWASASRERRQLEGSHRAVPEHSPGNADRLGVGLGSTWPDVQSHPAIRPLDAVAILALGLSGELTAEHQVDRQLQFAVALLGSLQCLLGELDALLLG